MLTKEEKDITLQKIKGVVFHQIKEAQLNDLASFHPHILGESLNTSTVTNTANTISLSSGSVVTDSTLYFNGFLLAPFNPEDQEETELYTPYKIPPSELKLYILDILETYIFESQEAKEQVLKETIEELQMLLRELKTQESIEEVPEILL